MENSPEIHSPEKPSSTLYGRLMLCLNREAYILGYSGRLVPRLIRKLLARTGIHRAWQAGYNGCFTQDGIKYGLANPFTAEKHDAALEGRFRAAEIDLPC